jgi:hypothetical protein
MGCGGNTWGYFMYPQGWFLGGFQLFFFGREKIFSADLPAT